MLGDGANPQQSDLFID